MARLKKDLILPGNVLGVDGEICATLSCSGYVSEWKFTQAVQAVLQIFGTEPDKQEDGADNIFQID